MTFLDTPYKVTVKKYSAGATDAHGNTVESWDTTKTLDAYSIAPAFSNEPFESGREAVITGYTILAPKPDFEVDAKDLFVLNGNDYTVEGEIGNWNQGPFEWEPGISISLKRVDG